MCLLSLIESSAMCLNTDVLVLVVLLLQCGMMVTGASSSVVQSIYAQTGVNLKLIATKGFSTVSYTEKCVL